MRRAFTAALAAVLVLGLASPATSDDAHPDLPAQVPSDVAALPDSATSRAPVVATGHVSGVDGNAQVVAEAWPSEEVLAAQTGGETFSLLPVARASVLPDGSYTLRVDRAALPPGYVSDDGMIDMQLTVWDGNRVGQTFATAAYSADARQWVQADAIRPTSTLFSRARSTEVAAASPTVPSLPVPTVDVIADTDQVDGSDVVMKWFQECYPTTLSTNTVAWATVGDGFPTAGQTSSFVFKNEQKVTVGIAVKASTAGATWQASGEETKTTTFSQEWAASSSHRYYQVAVREGYYRQDCYAVDASSKTFLFSQYLYKPISLTGGTRELATIYSPTWSGHCQNIAAGTWTRGFSNGNAYNNSAGLNLSSYIGINVSSKSQYDTSNLLRLHQSTSGYQACGNDRDPAYASRIRGGKA